MLLRDYRGSEDGGEKWSEPVCVDKGMPPPDKASRGMDAQIAGASDRLVAVWETKGTDAWGGGPMATAISSDGGKTWKPGPNPADDGATSGHRFIDVAADEDGAFHLVWLDGRAGKQGLQYARSGDGPLQFERVAGVVHPRVEHRGQLPAFRLGLARPHPRDVDPVAPAEGHVRPADGAGDDDAVRVAVDANWLGERGAAVVGPGVERVAVHRLALEVDEVDAAAGVDSGLRVDAAVGHPDRADRWRAGGHRRAGDA